MYSLARQTDEEPKLLIKLPTLLFFSSSIMATEELSNTTNCTFRGVNGLDYVPVSVIKINLYTKISNLEKKKLPTLFAAAYFKMCSI